MLPTPFAHQEARRSPHLQVLMGSLVASAQPRAQAAHLVDDVDAIAQPLSPQDGVQVVEPVA